MTPKIAAFALKHHTLPLSNVSPSECVNDHRAPGERNHVELSQCKTHEHPSKPAKMSTTELLGASTGCAHFDAWKSAAHNMRQARALLRYCSLCIATMNARARQLDYTKEPTSKRRRTEQSKFPLPMCTECSSSIDRIHACLQCPYMGCYRGGHFKRHLKNLEHDFGIDCASMTIYCNVCNDYIYDPELERIGRNELFRAYEKRSCEYQGQCQAKVQGCLQTWS